MLDEKELVPRTEGQGALQQDPSHSRAQEEAPPEGLSIWLPHPHPQQDKATGGSPVPLCSQFGPHPEHPSTRPIRSSPNAPIHPVLKLEACGEQDLQNVSIQMGGLVFSKRAPRKRLVARASHWGLVSRRQLPRKKS